MTRTLRDELRFDRLVTGLLAGLVVGVVVVIVAISFAVLIFSGPLAEFAPNGIGLALYTAVIMAGLLALSSSFPGMVATPQDVPAAITALIAASVAGRLGAEAVPGEVFATVVTAIAITSLATGVFFLALGFFKLGGLIRFIPYPVIGGFLAGTGWLLVTGSFGVMAGVPLAPGNLPRLLAPETIWLWIPGLVFAVALLLVLRRTQHYLVLPGMLVGAVVVFYALLWISGISMEEAMARGWLLGRFPDAGMWRPLGPALLAEVDWGAIAGEARGMLAVLIVGVVALLLNASGLELVVQRDIDLDRELRGAGVANLVSAAGGGLVGFQTLSLSALGHRVAPSSRLVGLVSAAMCGACLLFGSTLLSVFPKTVLGGLLLFLGLVFLVEWLWDGWFRLSKADYLVVLLILFVITTVGFLESVGVGIVIAVILFVVNYSRIDVVKASLSGVSHQSNVQRPRGHTRVLREHGEQLLILQLQGYVFFGTANNLLQRVRDRCRDASLPALRFVILDFRLVSGLDSSAVLSFQKMLQLAAAHDFALVLATTPPEIRQQLHFEELEEADGDRVHWHPELDRAVEWCEEQILLAEGLEIEQATVPLERQLEQLFPASFDAASFMGYLERTEVPAHHYLMRQDEPASELFLIESGQVTAQKELGEGRVIRLLTMGAGTVVGEMELYMEGHRAASVITETPSVAYRLSRESLLRMEAEQPELAAAFHRFIAHLLAERVTLNHKTLQALLR